MTADWPQVEEPETSTERGPRWTGLAPWALIPLAAAVWWVVGFLPWILDGMRIDLDGSPLAALPLTSGNLSVLVVGGGVGGLVSGLLVRLGHGARLASAAAVLVGVMIAAGVTLVQSFTAYSGPAPGTFGGDDRVLVGLTAVVITSTAVGVAWGLLSLAGDVGLGLSLAGVAGSLPIWAIYVLYAVGFDSWAPIVQLDRAARWAGVAILAAGLVRIGVRPLGRLVWWPVAVVLAWSIMPTITAAGYLEQLLRPGSALSEILRDQVSVTWQVWRMAAALDARPLAPWIVAVAAAVVGAVVLDRQRSRVPEPARSERTQVIG